MYDDQCGICRRLSARWADTLRPLGFEMEPLQSDWVAERLKLPPSELLSDIRLLLRDGSQRQGADVYRYVMRYIWWAWPIYLLSIVPLAGKAFDYAYRWFAGHRHLISDTCQL